MAPLIAKILSKLLFFGGIIVLTTVLGGGDIFAEKSEKRRLVEKWRVKTGYKLTYAPMVMGQRLLVPTLEALIALDKKTGKELWRFLPKEKIVWQGSIFTDENQIYLGVNGGGYYALSPNTGKVLWKTELGINSVKPAARHKGRLYVPTTHVWPPIGGVNPDGKAELLVLDQKDGKILDRFVTGNFILVSPFIKDNLLFLAGNYQAPRLSDESGHQRIYALDLSRGLKVVWTHESYDGLVKTLFADNGVLNYLGYEDYIVGLDIRNGNKMFRVHTGNWAQGFSHWDGKLYYGSALNKVVAIDQENGETLWQYKIPDKQMFSTIIGYPVIQQGNLYWLRNLNRQFTVVTADEGHLLWTTKTELAELSSAEPAVDGNRVYMSSYDGLVFGYDMEIVSK